MILYSEGATKAQEAEAESILETLTLAYPNHPWAVRVYEGGFFIKHLAFDGNYGMSCKFRSAGYSASALKRDIIMKAGEWLERAGLARGRGEGEEILWVEGVPDRHQPGFVGSREFGRVEGESEIRNTPRPQATKGIILP